ncbi:hypothetical protein [Exercitatus varius]|uniref:hypothetical protein n=1 Tax=Exercitatus varius TaxID=67857 RepID=UPI00294B43EC|nr:hypothetical protein [Exercitatus varius]MDG2958475.1 hypothetical protein [Exercitatus varius]
MEIFRKFKLIFFIIMFLSIIFVILKSSDKRYVETKELENEFISEIRQQYGEDIIDIKKHGQVRSFLSVELKLNELNYYSDILIANGFRILSDRLIRNKCENVYFHRMPNYVLLNYYYDCG